MRSPAVIRAMMTASSSFRAGGIMRVDDCPIISSTLKPNRRVAPAFQLVMIPSRLLPIIASDEDATIAESRSLRIPAASTSTTRAQARRSISVTPIMRAQLSENPASPATSVASTSGTKK